MTTTAHEDQFTPGTQTIERVRAPYDTASILRRNVVDLELALKKQTERAEAAEEKLTTAREDMQSWIDSRNGWMERAGNAEAELTKLREQKPVRWHVRGNYFRDGDAAILFASMNAVHGAKVEQLYAAPVPAPHKGATHCDGCGLTWLDDGLNPLGCPYCITNHNARRYLALRESGVMVSGHDFVKFDWSLDAAADRLLEGGK